VQIKEEKRKEGSTMKKLSLALATLLWTTPAWAAVRIIVEPSGKTATIKYATDGEKVRAFALDITVDKGVIQGISDFMRGESTKEKPGYGIFPANFARCIRVDPDTGDVAKWDISGYTPVADPCDPGALGGLGTKGITIEMGALYYPPDDNSPNAPPTQGTLFKLTLSEPAKLTVKPNQLRGGVVLTNAESAVVNTTEATGIAIASFSDGLPPTHKDYAEWVKVGRPLCWTFPRQCHGDADGLKEGDAKSGFHFVGMNDLRIFTQAWKVLEPPFGPGIASVENGICADFARDLDGNATTGFYRVGVTDLNRLMEYYLKPNVPGDCGGSLQP